MIFWHGGTDCHVKFSGWLAWLAWLFIHLIFLIGFRNRTSVFFQWAYSYFSYKRSARLITNLPPPPAPQLTPP
jgi:NADH dehydrogenase